jgi:hypothetical protein
MMLRLLLRVRVHKQGPERVLVLVLVLVPVLPRAAVFLPRVPSRKEPRRLSG